MTQRLIALFLFAGALCAQTAPQTRPVVLTWKGSATANYTVARGVLAADGSVSAYVQLTPTAISALTFVDTTAIPGTTYAYQITVSVPPCVSPWTISTVCGAGDPKTAPTAATITVSVPLLPPPPTGLDVQIP